MKPKMDIKRKNPDGISKVYEKLRKSTGKVAAVGFPRGAANAYPDGTEVATVAAAHVYGMGVPTRDFMGMAREDIMRRTKKAMNHLKQGGLNPQQAEVALEAAAQDAQSAIKNAITELSDPPLALATIDARRKAGRESTNPLIDTEHMRDSVTYVIRNKGGDR